MSLAGESQDSPFFVSGDECALVQQKPAPVIIDGNAASKIDFAITQLKRAAQRRLTASRGKTRIH
jgi:hypothetical protein